jgi:hypothetical protein
MNHDLDLDGVLDRWLDDGPTRVADRVMAAAMTDVHTTRQRGAASLLLEDFLMRFQPLAAPLAIAVVLAVTIGVAAIVSQPPPIGPEPSATETPATTSPSVAPSPTSTIAPTSTSSTAPTATPRAFHDFSELEGEWEGTIRRGGAGGLEFRIVAVIRAGAETGSPIAKVTHYQGAMRDPFCEGDWFALGADHPEYEVAERMGDEACVLGTVDLTIDPETGILSYSFRADHGAAAGFATGELSRIDP